MLGKLMKYDMRSGFRKFALIWIGLAALGVINGFTVKYVLDGENQNQLVNFFLGVLPMMLLVALYVAMGIFVLVFIVERFYKGLLGDEGYLMFTLPVTTSAHIGSKLLTGMIFAILSTLVAIVSGILLMLVLEPVGLREIIRAWSGMSAYLRDNPLPAGTGWVMAEFAVYTLVAMAAANLEIYTAISIGHLAKKHRGGFALLAYVGISIAFSIIMNGCMSLLLQSDAFPNALLNWEFCLDDTGWHVQGVGAIAAALGVALGLELLKGVGFFFATRAILSKRLNLE